MARSNKGAGNNRGCSPVALPVGHSASVSPDGRVLFFMSTRVPFGDAEPVQPLTWQHPVEAAQGPGNGHARICWVNASLLTEVRPD